MTQNTFLPLLLAVGRIIMIRGSSLFFLPILLMLSLVAPRPMYGGPLAGTPEIVTARQQGRFTIRWRNEEKAVEWKDLSFSIKVNDKWLEPDDFARQEWKSTLANGQGCHTLTLAGDTHGVASFRIDVQPNTPSLIVSAEYTATLTCQLGGFKILSSRETMPLPKDDGRWTVYSDAFITNAIGNLAQLDSQDPLMQGCWFASVQNAAAQKTFGFAALSAEQWPTWFEWERKGNSLGLTIRAGGETDQEAIEVAAGKTIHADPVLIGYWEGERPQNVLLQLADRAADNIKRTIEMRRPERGWSTWHYFFRDITAENIIAQAKALKDRLDPFCRIVQIDGGWWVNPGEFEVDVKRFPKGLADLSKQIRKQGFEFGLHMSPFRIAKTSPFWKEHPDYRIADAENNTKWIIDGSNPEAVKRVTKLYSDLARECHITYYKFDFLFHGAREGKRHDPTMTGLQAYNALIRAIRAAVPDEVIINNCNGLTLAAAECFDTWRVGPDINNTPRFGPKEEHANMTWGDPFAFIIRGKNQTHTLLNEARAVARGFYLHNRIGIIDCDSFIISTVYTLEEARCHVTLATLTGGTFFLGDRIDTLPAERLALVTNPRVQAIWNEGQCAIPVDLFDDVEVPRVWRLNLKDREIVAIYNWFDKERNDRWTLPALWLDANARYKITDVWSGEAVELKDGKLALTQPAHSVRLLEFARLK